MAAARWYFVGRPKAIGRRGKGLAACPSARQNGAAQTTLDPAAKRETWE
jgi:hypothetical protein